MSGRNNLRVRVGVIAPAGAATPVLVDAQTAPFHAPTRRITLSQDFGQECPPGWPAPPSMTGASPANAWCPRTIPAGSTFETFANVAAAIVAAGGASYA